MKLLRDTLVVFAHQFGLTVRSPAWLVIGIVQPLLYLGLFLPLLRNALGIATEAEAAALFVPGLLVLLLTGASAYAGVGLISDVRNGVLDRCQVSSVSRSALLLGRVLRDVVSYLFQAGLLIVVAVAIGMRPHLPGVLASLAVLGLVAAGLSAGSHVLALGASHEGAMTGLLQLLTLPVMLLSGIMIPLTFAPGWMQAIATVNPLAHVVTGTRELFAGRLASGPAYLAVAVALGMALVLVGGATRRFAVRLR